jgi:hypothetical protein
MNLLRRIITTPTEQAPRRRKSATLISPALATYDRAAMGTLSTQSGGEMAGIAPQAVIGAIRHKLMILALQEEASIEAPYALTSTASNVKPNRESADQ